MWRQVLTLTRLPRFLFQSWQRHAHAEELGFRDFSSLFLVKENRRQLGNSACCISFIEVGLTSRVFTMDEQCESGVQCQILNLAIELSCSTRFPEATIRATVNRLLSDGDEGMGFV